RYHHSPENQIVRGPTNWLWSAATGAYLAKVDDDALVPHGWLGTLRAAHRSNPELGVVGCWRFPLRDADPERVRPRLVDLAGGHQLLRCLWVEGSGYVMKRECVEA